MMEEPFNPKDPIDASIEALRVALMNTILHFNNTNQPLNKLSVEGRNSAFLVAITMALACTALAMSPPNQEKQIIKAIKKILPEAIKQANDIKNSAAAMSAETSSRLQ